MNENTPPLTPHELTRTEAIVELCKLAFGADDRQRLAVIKAVKALGKEIKHRADYARNLAARKVDPPFVAPAPAPISPDAPPMTEPSAPAPDAAETKPTTKPTTMNEKPLDDILTAMRGNEFDDPRLDADGIIGARNICRDFADKIEAALHDPQQVLNILAQFHDEHYSVFPRDQLTERLCHAFYGEFVKNPEEA